MLSERGQTWYLLFVWDISGDRKQAVGWNRAEVAKRTQECSKGRLFDQGWKTWPVCYKSLILIYGNDLLSDKLLIGGKAMDWHSGQKNWQILMPASTAWTWRKWCLVKKPVIKWHHIVWFIWGTQSSQLHRGRTETVGGQSWERWVETSGLIGTKLWF